MEESKDCRFYISDTLLAPIQENPLPHWSFTSLPLSFSSFIPTLSSFQGTGRMERGKTEMKRMEACFSRRSTGLLKKAHELGVLCSSQVAVIIFSHSGNLFEYCNVSMEQILARYSNSSNPSMNTAGGIHPVSKQCVPSWSQALSPSKPEEQKDEIRKVKIERLDKEQLLLLEKNLDDISLEELEDFEEQLSETLHSVRERKEQMFDDNWSFQGYRCNVHRRRTRPCAHRFPTSPAYLKRSATEAAENT